jgi:hypothetical protein
MVMVSSWIQVRLKKQLKGHGQAIGHAARQPIIFCIPRARWD